MGILMGNLEGNSPEESSLFRFPIFPLPVGEGKGEREEGKKLTGICDGKREGKPSLFRCGSCTRRRPVLGSGYRHILGLRTKICRKCKRPKGAT